MWNYVAVALGGVVGCCARFGVTQAVQAWFGRPFPLATLSINVSGCLLMGFLFFYTADRFGFATPLRVALLTGLLGGYTTFSAFAIETLLMVEQGRTLPALLYVTLSVFLSLAAVFAGAWVARAL